VKDVQEEGEEGEEMQQSNSGIREDYGSSRNPANRSSIINQETALTVIKEEIRHEVSRFDSITYQHPVHQHLMHSLDEDDDEDHLTTSTGDHTVE